MTCPGCLAKSNMIAIPNAGDVITQGPPVNFTTGVRMCPDPNCRALCFFVTDVQGNVVETAPVATPQFDEREVPPVVAAPFREALLCHQIGAHRAAALLVRRTIEMLCDDNEATGHNLEKRIEALGTKIALPDHMKTALHDLRLLGNDAAHVNAKDYDAIGADEIEIAFRVATWLLHTVYSTKALAAELAARKKPSPSPLHD